MLDQVKAAAIDGRLENVFWRQQELQRLYKALIQKSSSVQNAIQQHGGVTRVEAKVEFCRALHILKQRYLELQPETMRQEEYLIAHGQDAPGARRAFGIAYIVPTTHTIFYSIVTAVAAAIAAGNCCILELGQTPHELPQLIGNVVKEGLDPDIFDIVTNRTVLDVVEQPSIYFSQTGEACRAESSDLATNDQRRVVAVVDRTADVASAAKALVEARFAYGGSSPYAPDHILVNEYSKSEFLSVAAQTAVKLMAVREDAGPRHQIKQLLTALQKADGPRVVTTGSNGIVVDVTNGGSSALPGKLRLPCLVVEGITSLDRTFEYARENGRYLAGFYFGTPEAAKYLSQFIDSDVCFCNHIPQDLLLGPAAPFWTQDMAAHDRTPAHLFSRPSPRFIKQSQTSQELEQILEATNPTALHALEQQALTGWNDFKRRPVGGTVGFFEQGILVGLSVVLLTAASTVGLSIYGYRAFRLR